MKRDRGNKFRESKNGGKEVWVSLEWPKNKKYDDPPRWPSPRSSARSGRVRRWFTVKLGMRDCLVGTLLPGRACSKGVAGDASHGQNPFGLKMGRNDLLRCSRSWEVFSRVLELKMSVLGLGFYLACKTRFILSLGSFSSKNHGLTWTLLKYCCLNSPGP